VKQVFIVLLLLQSPLIFSQSLTNCGAHFPPSTLVVNDQLIKGYSVDLIKESFKRLNWQFEFQVLPWKRCIALVKQGELDAVIDTSIHNQPIVTGNYPISYNQLGIYVRWDFLETRYQKTLFKDKIVGMPRGYSGYQKIAKEHAWQTYEADNESILFTMLKKGRLDYVLSDNSTAFNVAKSIGAKIKPLLPYVQSQKYYLGFSPFNDNLAQDFDAMLEQMLKDGSMDNIYLKYLPYGYQEMYEKAQATQ